VFNIQNVATASYPGLPICDCIHAAPWMQFAYFAMGPIYYLLIHSLKLNRFLLKNK
jgi:hypothetical protein